MASLDIETEKTNFRDFYSENIGQLDEAQKTFCTLIKDLLQNLKGE